MVLTRLPSNDDITGCLFDLCQPEPERTMSREQKIAPWELGAALVLTYPNGHQDLGVYVEELEESVTIETCDDEFWFVLGEDGNWYEYENCQNPVVITTTCPQCKTGTLKASETVDEIGGVDLEYSCSTPHY